MARITFITNDHKVIEAADGSNLLRASLRDRGGIPFKCGGGICGTCRCRIESGLDHTDKVKDKERRHLTDADLAQGYRMACQTFVNGDISVSWIPPELRPPGTPGAKASTAPRPVAADGAPRDATGSDRGADEAGARASSVAATGGEAGGTPITAPPAISALPAFTVITASAVDAPASAMVHVTDAMVDRLLAPSDPQIEARLRQAFIDFSQQAAATQSRVRTEAGGVKLSTMGAVIPGQGVLGAKVYSTLAGRFAFVIVLFSAADGRPLATFEANAITRLRTAAASLLAARTMARPASRSMLVYGAGVQGLAHARLFAPALGLQQVWIAGRQPIPETTLAQLSAELSVPVQQGGPQALSSADIVVTASRSATPLFGGDALRPGTFIAAVGSSLPTTRELDDRTLQRARSVVVEWGEQTCREAGDLVLADPAALPAAKVLELGEVLAGRAQARHDEDDIVVWKSVGIGLLDIAIAGLAWERLQARRG